MLRFLLEINKQSGRCHVLLATSEYAFRAWLNTAIGPRFWLPKVIGDFTEAEARAYLVWQLQRLRSGVALDDAAWAAVYDVCGGNAGDLGRVAMQVTINQGNWDAALEVLWGNEEERIELLALGGPGWTGSQFAAAALLLLTAPHHACPLRDMEVLLGRQVVGAGASVDDQRKAGQQVLLRLVEANALSVRPISNWAGDIPPTAFRGVHTVVTATATMDLYCMRRMKQKLQQRLQDWEQQKQQVHATATAQPSRPPSPSSTPEVQRLQQKVEEVAGELSNVSKDIAAARDGQEV